MFGSSELVIVFLWVGVGGGIGALIGSTKGRGGLGFVLGFLLGVIGWIIIAVIGRSPEKEAHRYFDGDSWTDQVSDAGVVGVDAPRFPLPNDSTTTEGWAADPADFPAPSSTTAPLPPPPSASTSR